MGTGRSPAASWGDRDGLLVGASVVGLALVAVLLGRTAPVLPRRADLPAIARVTFVSGGVLRRPTGSLVWEETGAGQPLAALDAIYVPPGGAAQLAFDAGAAIDLDERSLVIVEPAVDDGARAPAVRLLRGSLEAGAGPSAPHIRSSEGEAVLAPGSRGRFMARAAGAPWVQLRQGEARVDGTRQEAPAHPVELEAPAAGARVHLPTFPGLALLRWQGDGAQVQLARDPSFAEPAVIAPADGDSEVQAALSGPGVYHWRVTGADGAPLSEARRLVVLQDRAPRLYAPAPGEIVEAPPGKDVMFWWTAVEDVTRYQLEIAADAAFTSVLLAREVEGGPSAWIASELPEGVYQWRVRALDAARPAAPFSTPGSFRLVHAAVPGAPELLDPTLEVGDDPR